MGEFFDMIPSKDEKLKSWYCPLTLGGMVFLALGTILMLTNPGPKQYEDFATEQLILYLKENVCQPKSPDLGSALKSQMCNLMVDTGKKQVPQVIAKTTQRHNYLLLSIYETHLYAYNIETIGIFNHFYIIGIDKLYDRE
jgi:hypothetical protein